MSLVTMGQLTAVHRGPGFLPQRLRYGRCGLERSSGELGRRQDGLLIGLLNRRQFGDFGLGF